MTFIEWKNEVLSILSKTMSVREMFYAIKADGTAKIAYESNTTPQEYASRIN